MIQCEVILPSQSITGLIATLKGLPDEMRPQERSDDEDGGREAFSTERATSLGDLNGFLWAARCGYHITEKEDAISLFAFSEYWDGMKHLVYDLSKLPVQYGYACCTKEREHRNRLVLDMNYGVHEAWVGRDYKAYLPGLYWINILPDPMVSQFRLDLSSVEGLTSEASVSKGENITVQLYSHPSRWTNYADAVDKWCGEKSSCFSKGIIEADAKNLGDFISVSDLVRSYP